MKIGAEHILSNQKMSYSRIVDFVGSLEVVKSAILAPVQEVFNGTSTGIKDTEIECNERKTELGGKANI
jgi:hypothetical protein